MSEYDDDFIMEVREALKQAWSAEYSSARRNKRKKTDEEAFFTRLRRRVCERLQAFYPDDGFYAKSGTAYYPEADMYVEGPVTVPSKSTRTWLVNIIPDDGVSVGNVPRPVIQLLFLKEHEPAGFFAFVPASSKDTSKSWFFGVLSGFGAFLGLSVLEREADGMIKPLSEYFFANYLS